MAEYHVRKENDNIIYAGTLSKTGKLINKSNVTEEVLAAVRDHFIAIAANEKNDNVGYAWTYDNGITVRLMLQMEKPEEK